jgi:acyl dehydratase
MSSIVGELQRQIGSALCSEWLLIDQAMIDRFADATLDHQFIHVNSERAAASPFGGTIAHGFLTLSLLSHLRELTPDLDFSGIRMGVNYGFDKVRFISPVRSGSRVRACWTPASIEEKAPGTYQLVEQVEVEIERESRPALAATWITRFIV